MSDNFSLQYLTIDSVIQAILKLGQYCFMAKTDIEAAFCQYPVHPDDWELLGMQWTGKYYFDKIPHLGYVVPRSSLLGLVMLLNGLPFMTC